MLNVGAFMIVQRDGENNVLVDDYEVFKRADERTIGEDVCVCVL